MITPLSQPFDDFIPVATETIMLTDRSTQWAQSVCRDITDTDEQWHSFLRALAIAGFEQWLNQSNNQLPITYAQDIAPGINANLQVGDFRLCILPMGVLQDDPMMIPATAVQGQDKAHLYVLVEVHEEVDQVLVAAGLRHDQLKKYIEQNLQPEAKNYGVPVSQFTVSPEKLLLYLSCLQPEAIIPTVVEDGKTIASSIKSAAARVINTGKWLQGQLDAVADELTWQLVPVLSPSYGFRTMGKTDTPIEKLSKIVEGLNNRGVEIPTDATGAYGPVTVGDMTCQVYSLVWALPDTKEWSLFMLLGPVDDQRLPVGTELQVSDENTVLSRRDVSHDAMTTYLYTQAFGTLDEQFTVAISSPNGETLILPPFRFEPSN